LTQIFIEHAENLGPLFAYISKYEASEAKLYSLLPKNASPQFLCSPTWAYLISSLAPVVRQLNLQRTVPLILTPIDSITTDIDPSLPGIPPSQGTVGSCKITNQRPIAYVFSHDRERNTADHFISKINESGPNDKALILYHSFHLAKNLEICRFGATAEGALVSDWGPSSWVGFLPQDLQDEIYVLIFDEVDSAHAPNGLFNYPDVLKQRSNFFINTVELPSALGLNSSLLTDFSKSPLRFTEEAVQVAQGIWWTPSDQLRPFPPAAEKMPILCRGQ
jgi:hypothetical protein